MSETRTTSSSGGEKGVKPERYDLIPVQPLRELARVYGYGVGKYTTYDENGDEEYQGPDNANWTKGYEWSKNFGAMQRHIEKAREGEWFDDESGRPHLAHAAWHCFTLMWFHENRAEFDDRLLTDYIQMTAEGLQEILDDSLVVVDTEGRPWREVLDELRDTRPGGWIR